ncbi:MAG TPA: F0F1 ATP synthase subunit A [Chloroflexota bacterium]|nr:F0F1 ATP synthase subunit A [Chloroflexota bacterium]
MVIPIPILGDIAGEIGKHWSLGPDPGKALVAGILHIDTLISTLIIMAILIGVAAYLRPRITSGVPGGLQNMIETLLEFVINTATDLIGEARTKVIAPMAVSLGLFILLSNWLGLLPTGGRLKSPTADMNTTFALAIIVVLYVHYSSIKARGPGKYLKSWLNPLTIIEELPKPVTLSLRLFGNIAAGEILLILLGNLPAVLVLSPIPTVIWVAFSLFIGGVQAFVFVMLTIAYYGIGTEIAGH